MEPTLDPGVVIVARGVTTGGVPWMVYEGEGRRWRVSGTCNQCGLCVVGAAHPEHYAWDGPPGMPYAVRDLRLPGRLDEPVALGFERDLPGCTLVTEAVD